MIRINGHKDPERRATVEASGFVLFPELGPETGIRFAKAIKTTPAYVTQCTEPFEVDTLEGLHTGKAGDYLAIGPHGEMYPIDQEVFEASYEVVEE